ncbi:homoserine dehydrogenase [Bacillus pseudomycoides]|uniref:Homoserine dehydrogenase n=1 Tax=Bacillus pseudomycoides TaxID=64104 RepID=A0AAJ3RFJ6_9BACI|nr:homoserine dehydrogenase [Bacillus pseudomycoides]MBD5798062.1 homoserine dehydrogenase [Bacillus pseudomycoides]MDR4328405.1 homoserine dehydrogenase [Bacillus pseudomycoides]MED1476173.1 homoserine dehydrogenase [Bacillus pseudomycoides]MED1538027.1 homoserine dehydrogenase [Bacillus pseudomycoides]MED1624640.1 homoserine dehydrogenase [Bacillus pseudomycoides]
MRVNVVISGYGTVGKEFVRLVFEKASYIKEMYGIELVFTGIIGSTVNLYNDKGLHIKELLTYGTGSHVLEKYTKHYPLDKSEKFPFGTVLIESTPTNLQTGEPGRTYIETAIENHMDVVAISKGALVNAWKEIKEKAKLANVRICYSGATAAALPTLDIGQFSLAGCQIENIEGILNGTTNYILTKMYEEDVTFQEALHQAQHKGIAETNPSLDVSGMDSACKLLLLANSLLQAECSLNCISIKGIEDVTKQDIEKAKEQGKSLKLIATAYKDHSGNLKLEVCPREIEKGHPLAHVNGTEKGITFHTDTMGKVTSTGGASSPRGAAAAALKDLINLYRKDV